MCVNTWPRSCVRAAAGFSPSSPHRHRCGSRRPGCSHASRAEPGSPASASGGGARQGVSQMTQLLTPKLDVSCIDVEEGLNARRHFDPDALKRLADSVGHTGMVEPIVVRPAGKGRYTVTAGHRRLEAARIAGLKRVPVVVNESADARTA